MNPAPWTSFLIARELRGFAREIELFPDDDQIWQTLPGISNSAGTLALHVCGNLQHFVGAVLGGLRPPTGLFLHHLACHLSHHLGQAGYLRRALTGENRSSGTVSMESLAAAFPDPG